MPSFVDVTNGNSADASGIQQVVDALKGTSGKGIPLSPTAVNDALSYALAVKNNDAGASKALIVYKADGTVLFQVDKNGVIASADGVAGASQLVTATGTQTLTNKTLTSPVINTPTFSAGAIPTAAIADAAVTSVKASLSTASNVLGADVLLNNIANYFDGPSMAQGTAGTWLVTGSVTVSDTAAATISAKLWDGTTVIASTAEVVSRTANDYACITLSGILASPAGNIRISVRDSSTVNGRISFNASGNSKDASIFGIRIA